ncbi:MAG: hypothetical protein CFE34_06705 [Rhodobacteraceae bacterium PARR1]|nr:MAG: hypothetical protein CFE34_06705 [Rhodobacteraceae bacterium PARR1]
MEKEITRPHRANNGDAQHWENPGLRWERTGVSDQEVWESPPENGESLDDAAGIFGLSFPEGDGKTSDLGNSLIASPKDTADTTLSAEVLFQMMVDLLPAGHIFDQDRQVIFACRSDETREDICGPIAVLRSVHDLDGTNWSREVAFIDRGGDVKALIIPDDDLLGGTAVAKRFASMGLAIYGSPKDFLDFLKAWEMPGPRAVRLHRQGWASPQVRAFMFPDGMIIGADPNDTAHQFVGRVARSDFAPVAASACLAMRPLVRGNAMAITAICAGLAGPILGLFNANGFGLHLAGPSGIGKSTLGKLAQSVWSTAPLATGEATSAAVLATLVRGHHGLVVIDELRPKKGQAEVAYSMGNGNGRGRTNGQGDLIEPTHTVGIVLTTGEISAADAISGSGDQVHDGQMVRHITLPLVGFPHGIFDVLNGFASFEDLAAAISEAGLRHGGSMARRFITQLCRWEGDISKDLKAMIARNHHELISQLVTSDWPTDPKAKRVLRNFAVLQAAGELAESFGMACWDEGDLVPSIREAARRALLFLRKPDLFSALPCPDEAARDARRKILMYVDARHRDLHIKGRALSAPEDNILGWLDETRLHLRASTFLEVFGDEETAKTAISALRQAGDLPPASRRPACWRRDAYRTQAANLDRPERSRPLHRQARPRMLNANNEKWT